MVSNLDSKYERDSMELTYPNKSQATRLSTRINRPDKDPLKFDEDLNRL
jgi:hypothetical protein